MRLSTLGAFAALLAISSSAISTPEPLSASSAAWEANVVPCRLAVAASFRHDLGFLDRYIAAQGMSAGDANVQRVLCTSYAIGAFDMAEGRIVPLDPE